MATDNILVIDDDQSISEFLKEALERDGYKVTIAHRGDEGIKLFKQHRQNMIFVDMKLPDTHGIDVLKKIRAVSSKAIVIIITGHGSIDNAVEAMNAGAYNYLTKPLSIQTLKAAIEKAKENQKIQENQQTPLQTITVNGVQTDPGFVKF